VLLDPKTKDSHLDRTGTQGAEVLICSYEFALRHEASLLKSWDLVVADEAHRLRNYWNGRTKVAEAVAHIVATASKTLLLTATPLQNRLEELYGLVSVFDPSYFYSLNAFRERYIKSRDLDGDDDLVDRVAAIAKRTLRRDAEKYIRFTKRMPLTVEFTPSPEEIKLYDLVNAYLQRDELYAFAGSQRHLSALIIRKRLGSSTYAVSSTLENIANRLASELEGGQRRDRRGSLVIDEDLLDEELEEVEEASWENPEFDHSDKTLVEKIQAEVDELRDYAALARSITVNQKAVKLNDALRQGFARLREIGASEKAIIFTESTKTQEYIARSLRDAGRGEDLVIFNGSNDSSETTAVYRAWLEVNKDSDVITGIPAADRRKALIDYFRDTGSIMIATEAAAEGINLQFCSMVVNYDLPWNPQRVEQRIGRAHRFGQKHNVVVVNFANKGNIAEARILELLATKFHLFESVFGASDEVLGAIEDGLNFETTISELLNRCKTSAEIDQAFKELEEQYSTDISREMRAAKAKVFDNLDPHVQDRLKAYDTQSGDVLNKFERLLLVVTKHQLRDHATFEDDGRNFLLHTAPVSQVPTGPYYFKSRPLQHAHQYRYASPLAQHVVSASKAANTPACELTFSLGKSARVSTAVKKLAGKSGELTVSVVRFTMRAKNDDVSESYMLAGGFTDDGQWLDHEYVADILDLSCTHIGDTVDIDQSRFAQNLDTYRGELEKEVQGRNSRYYDQQEELLYRNEQDRKAESEGKIREDRAKEREHRRLAKRTDDPLEQLRHKKEARKWAERAEREDEDSRADRRKLRIEADRFLDLVEQSLKGTQETEHLFSIRWKVTT